MKNIIILFLLFSIVACNGQKEKKENNEKTEIKQISKEHMMKKFDIEKFKKNQESGIWSFATQEGNKVTETDVIDGYTVETTFKDKVLILSESYHSNGIFAGGGVCFLGGFLKGIWINYNEKGEITKQVDYDIPYKNYPWEKVEAYLVSKKVDLKDNYTRVWREENTDGTFWMISWDANKLSNIGTKTITNIVIDVKTGKIVKEYETIYRDN